MQTFQMRLRCAEIQNVQDRMMIERALSSSPGIDRVEVDLEKHEVSVSTVNQDGGENVLRTLDHAGFACVRVASE